jgi:esterase/lipase
MVVQSHLVVVLHGILGGPSKMGHIKKCVETEVGPACVVYVPRCNALLQSLDGIDVGGRRAFEEVKAYLAERLAFETISVIGFSLGGLYARYFMACAFDPETGNFFLRN